MQLKVNPSTGEKEPIGNFHLKLEHEESIIQFCIYNMRSMHFKHEVKATAISYLHRFYLHNSAVEVDPSKMIYACVYLAAKVEEENINVNTFCDKVKKEP